jgi:hypothetical protein
MENDTMVTAITASEATMIDWRKYSDGEQLCKQLKELEANDESNGMQLKDWMDTIQTAGQQDAKQYTWEKNVYEDDDTELEYSYGTFAEAAAWNFNRAQPPQFSAGATPSFAGQADDQQHMPTIEPTPIEPALLDGTSYARTSPTFFKARIGSPNNRSMAGLLDNCASLSLLDRKILNDIPGVKTHEKMVRIQGVGADISKEFCVLPIYIDCVRACGGVKEKARIKIWVEFHIIDALNESYVIGMDVIAPYQINIITSRREARIRAPGAHDVPFPIYFGKGMPRALIQESHNVVASETVTIPPRCETTVKVMIAGNTAQTPYDIFVDPIPLVNTATEMFGLVGKGVYSAQTEHVWFANMGNYPITVRRGTRLGTASHLSSTDTVSPTKIRHKIGGNTPASMFSCTPKKCGDHKARAQIARQARDGWPTAVLNYNAGLMDPNDRHPPRDETAQGQFDISSDFGEDGKPPECIVKVINENIEAFTLDGRPGRLTDGTILTLDTDDDKLVPEKLRQMSPRKKAVCHEPSGVSRCRQRLGHHVSCLRPPSLPAWSDPRLGSRVSLGLLVLPAGTGTPPVAVPPRAHSARSPPCFRIINDHSPFRFGSARSHEQSSPFNLDVPAPRHLGYPPVPPGILRYLSMMLAHLGSRSWRNGLGLWLVGNVRGLVMWEIACGIYV